MSPLDWISPASPPLLGFVTTIHCALLVLLKHRQPGARWNSKLLPSLALTCFPWILTTPAWLASVLLSHLAWISVAGRWARADTGAGSPRSNAAQDAPGTPPARPVAGPPSRSSSGFTDLTVLATIPETPEIRTFRLTRPAGFDFAPGQFLTVKVELDGKPMVRCYSISSSPLTTGYLEISVRRQGQVSGFLHATACPGSTLFASGPGGTFVYPAGHRPIVLVAGGIGITPLLSMARYALATEPNRPVTLVLSARHESSLPFIDELQLLARRHPRFRLVVAVSGGTSRDGYYAGRIDRGLIETVIDHITESVYLICGPLSMIDDLRRLLADLQVPVAQIHYERFEAAVASSAPTIAPTSTSFSTSVVLKRRGCRVKVRAGQSILDAAEEAGEVLPSMCRAGVCGSCRTRLIEGDVEGDFPAIDEADRAEGYVLTCMAVPVADCVLDA